MTSEQTIRQKVVNQLLRFKDTQFIQAQTDMQSGTSESEAVRKYKNTIIRLLIMTYSSMQKQHNKPRGWDSIGRIDNDTALTNNWITRFNTLHQQRRSIEQATAQSDASSWSHFDAPVGRWKPPHGSIDRQDDMAIYELNVAVYEMLPIGCASSVSKTFANYIAVRTTATQQQCIACVSELDKLCKSQSYRIRWHYCVSRETIQLLNRHMLSTIKMAKIETQHDSIEFTLPKMSIDAAMASGPSVFDRDVCSIVLNATGDLASLCKCHHGLHRRITLMMRLGVEFSYNYIKFDDTLGFDWRTHEPTRRLTVRELMQSDGFKLVSMETRTFYAGWHNAFLQLSSSTEENTLSSKLKSMNEEPTLENEAERVEMEYEIALTQRTSTGEEYRSCLEDDVRMEERLIVMPFTYGQDAQVAFNTKMCKYEVERKAQHATRSSHHAQEQECVRRFVDPMDETSTEAFTQALQSRMRGYQRSLSEGVRLSDEWHSVSSWPGGDQVFGHFMVSDEWLNGERDFAHWTRTRQADRIDTVERSMGIAGLQMYQPKSERTNARIEQMIAECESDIALSRNYHTDAIAYDIVHVEASDAVHRGGEHVFKYQIARAPVMIDLRDNARSRNFALIAFFSAIVDSTDLFERDGSSAANDMIALFRDIQGVDGILMNDGRDCIFFNRGLLTYTEPSQAMITDAGDEQQLKLQLEMENRDGMSTWAPLHQDRVPYPYGTSGVYVLPRSERDAIDKLFDDALTVASERARVLARNHTMRVNRNTDYAAWSRRNQINKAAYANELQLELDASECGIKKRKMDDQMSVCTNEQVRNTMVREYESVNRKYSRQVEANLVHVDADHEARRDRHNSVMQRRDDAASAAPSASAPCASAPASAPSASVAPSAVPRVKRRYKTRRPKVQLSDDQLQKAAALALELNQRQSDALLELDAREQQLSRQNYDRQQQQQQQHSNKRRETTVRPYATTADLAADKVMQKTNRNKTQGDQRRHAKANAQMQIQRPTLIPLQIKYEVW